MSSATSLPAGTFLQIQLEDSTFAYGRALEDPYTAFYDFNTSVPVDDCDELEDQPILFIQTVRMQPSARWKTIGQRELSGDLTKPVVRFKQSLGDYRECVVYDSSGMSRKVAPEECVGLERAAVWEMHHIEQRLIDHFMGRPNVAVEHARVRLK